MNALVISTWVNDLQTVGVFDPISQQHLSVCPYDLKNLALSGQAMLNSCSLGLKEAIIRAIPEKDHNGPTVFYAAMQQIAPPSHSESYPFLRYQLKYRSV